LKLDYTKINDLLKNNERIKENYSNEYWKVQEWVNKEINSKVKIGNDNRLLKRILVVRNKEIDNNNSWNGLVLSDWLAM